MISFLFALFLFSCNNSDEAPVVYTLDGELLQFSGNKLKEGDSLLNKAVQKLLKDAGQSLSSGPFTVVSKKRLPPSGDRHDYISMGPYWWPDPDKPDGLPYIRKDGEVNPEVRLYEDYDKLKAMIKAVRSLTIAYYFTGEEKYASHASLLIRTWFIDPETRMNPHLNYGQSVPGITDGRQYGIIETLEMPYVIDGIGLIQDSESWTEADQKAMVEWFKEFLNWLLHSTLGRDEADQPNNHGTWYDVQCVTYALFTDQVELAVKIINENTLARLSGHIKPDGSQPMELARTRSWGYSVMNLKGFFMLAGLAKKLKIDLINDHTGGKSQIQTALDFFIPYLRGDKEWEYKQIVGIDYSESCLLLRLGTIYFGNLIYEELLDKYASNETLEELNLLWPVKK
jgi:hypothetical protein